MRGSRILAAAAGLVLVAGCGDDKAIGRTAPHFTKLPLPKSRCSSYLGGGVAIAICNKRAKDELHIALDQPDSRTGSAIGIAQALGEPLRDGEQFELGAVPTGSEVLVNLNTGSAVTLHTGQRFPRIASALFRLPRVRQPQTLEVRVSFDDGRVFTSLTLGAGRVVGPEGIYLPDLSRY